ncbi:MAG TPA: NAD(P)-dependent oxidoreductase [Bacillales bacterium]|nr:NAD(P)-dependent oxidoreductase [Bacillales bacterium]
MIGFIGLGIMGSRMANNLLAAGHDLVIYNRTKEKAERLLEKGAKWGQSPKETAEEAEVLITMLADPGAVSAMALGEEGFMGGLASGKLWIDCSTVNPSFTRKMAAIASERGMRFVDAPAAGSKAPAEKGELVFVAGGNEEDVEEARPYLEAMGKAVNHVGGIGKGTSMKMVVNLMLAQAMEAFSEAVTLGEALGLEKDKVLDTLVGGPVTAPFLAGKRDKVANGHFEVEFPLELMRKDLQLAAESAYENGISLPATNVVKELYGLASQKGLAKKDFSAIYQFLSEKS